MSVFQDMQFGFRVLIRDRWFSLAAVVALGLGIAVTTTIFTLVNAVMIRDLPFARADRLVAVVSRTARGFDAAVSLRDLQDVREATSAFEESAYWFSGSFNLGDEDQVSERVEGSYTSPEIFDVIGEQPRLGRGFLPEDDEPGAPGVVILGYGVWTQRYGADPAILGQRVRVNGLSAAVVGVMPEGLRFPPNSDIWVPAVHAPAALRSTARNVRAYTVLARLADGVTLTAVSDELAALSARLARDFPETNEGFTLTPILFADRVNGAQIELVFGAMMGAVIFVLLIACTNVANLSLARSTRRVGELSVRASLGATRWRLVRQLLVESVMLSTTGGLLGLGLAVAGVRVFDVATSDVGKPYWMAFSLDPAVFAFLAATCLASGIAFGVVPALHVSTINPYAVLKEGGRSNTGGRGARRWAGVFVAGQLALTLVLLAGAGFMVRSFMNLYTLDLGVDTGPIVVAEMTLPGRDYPDDAARVAFFRQVDDRMRGAASIQAGTFASNRPLAGAAPRQLDFDGRPLPGEGQRPAAFSVGVGPDYFTVLDLPLREGRALTAQDGDTGFENVVVNQAFVDRHLPGRSPLGRRFRFVADTGPFAANADQAEADPWLTIVGVVPIVTQLNPQDTERDGRSTAGANALVYLPLALQSGFAPVYLARSAARPSDVASTLREIFRSVDPNLALYDVMSLDAALAGNRWPYRVFGSAFGVFALIALVMSGLGLYAISAYAVVQRTAEVGIRMALGAQRSDVRRLFLRRSLRLVAVGLAVGLAGAAGVGQLLRSLLIQVGPGDPLTLAAVAVILTGIAVAACLVPLRRATRVDPVSALRYG